MVTGPNPGGFTDPEVGVLRIDGMDGRPVAAIVTFGCHPTYLGPANTLISPDYPGVTRDVFESITATPCVFLQAGAGNVGPFRGFLGETTEVERCGTILGCETAQTYLAISAARDSVPGGFPIEVGVIWMGDAYFTSLACVSGGDITVDFGRLENR
jgi:hypothetical protein